MVVMVVLSTYLCRSSACCFPFTFWSQSLASSAGLIGLVACRDSKNNDISQLAFVSVLDPLL